MFKDNLEKGELFGVKFKKLHGHTQIFLTDEKTGKREKVADKDNLVTLAVPNIYEENLGGVIDYSELVPVYNMFAGVMCFEDELAVTDLMPPCEGDNSMIAHAGQTAHESASTKRGNPNGQGTAPSADGKGYQYQWDFASNQGNGTISSLALVHGNGGDIGLQPIDAQENKYLIKSLCNKSVTIASGNRAARGDFDTFLHGVVCYDGEEDIGYHVSGAGVVSEVQFFYKKTGLNYSISDTVVLATHNTNLLGEYIFYEDGFLYSILVTTTTSITVTKVDIETWTETTSTINLSSEIVKPTWSSGNTQIGYAARINTVVKSGDYVYLPMGTQTNVTNFLKVNLTTGANTPLALNTPTNYSFYLFPTAASGQATPRGGNGQMNISDGLVIGANYIINDDAIYASTLVVPENKSAGAEILEYHVTRYVPLTKKPAFLEWLYTFGNSASTASYIYLSVAYPTVYLATIQNLDSPVTKPSDRNMTIIYTLTEVGE